jgi:hypothetical protein
MAVTGAFFGGGHRPADVRSGRGLLCETWLPPERPRGAVGGGGRPMDVGGWGGVRRVERRSREPRGGRLLGGLRIHRASTPYALATKSTTLMAVEPRTQNNRRGRRERRVEQKRDVLIDAPSASSALSAVKFALSRALRRPRNDAWNRRQEQERGFNRRGRRERREEQQGGRANRCPPSASSAFSAVKPALSRALRRPRNDAWGLRQEQARKSTAEAAKSAE